MNKLKQAVGLLNDEAPKNHFLAYINDKEAKLLKQAGGSGEMTTFGVPSFIDYGDVESGLAGGEFGGGSPQETFGGGSDNNTDDSQDDDKALSYVNFDPNTPTSSLNDIGSDSDNSGAIANLINLAKVPYDLVKGNLPTSVLSLLNTNQPKSMPNTTGEDGIGEGDYNTNRDVFDTVQDYRPDYYSLGQEEQALVDKEFFDQGYRTKDFRDFYSGDTTLSNKQLTTTESDNVSKALTFAPYIISGNEAPQESMVNNYFANMGNNQSLSQGLLDSYADAKNNIASTLGLVDNTNQFGFNNNSIFSRNNRTGNPFYIDYMITKGLI